MAELNREEQTTASKQLSQIFSLHAHKRICVVGTSCVGKSTLIRHFPDAIDMDDILFGDNEKGNKALLTQEEIEYVSGLWTPEIGQFMIKKAREYITIEVGHPVFGTVVLPSDVVVEITVPDAVLRERVEERRANERAVFAMKTQIESEIERSGIEKIVVENR